MLIKFVKVTTEGKVSIVRLDGQDYRSMAREIGADLIQYVRVMVDVLGMDRYEMMVDEEGLLVDDPKVNPVGCLLYGTFDHGHPIMGDILLTIAEDGPYGRDSVDIPDREAVELCVKLEAAREALVRTGGWRDFKTKFAGARAEDFPVRVIPIPEGKDFMDFL